MRLLPFLPLLALGACALPTAKVQPRFGLYSISGDGSYSDGMSGGGTFDFEDEANLDDEETPALRAEVKFGAAHLIATADLPQFSGTGTVNVDIGGITAGSTVDTELDFGFFNGLVVFDLVPGDTVEVGIGVGLSYITLDQMYREQMFGTTEQDEEEFFLPVVAGLAAVHIGPVEVSGLVSGLAIEYEDDSLFYLTGDLNARLKIFGGTHRIRGSLIGGVWISQIDVDYTDDDGTAVDTDILITAPYAGIEFSL